LSVASRVLVGGPENALPPRGWLASELTAHRCSAAAFRLHDLRHTHATHQLAAHANHREVADRLGHADPAFTLRVYAQGLPGAQRANAEAVARLVADSATNAATNRPEEAARDAS
jgi:integrase